MTTLSTPVRLIASASSVAILLTVLALLIAGSGAQATTPNRSEVAIAATSSQAESFSHYSRDLEQLAHRYVGFGYYQANVNRTIKLGFVGGTPSRVLERIAQAPDGVDVHLGHSLFTNQQLMRAISKAIGSGRYSVYEAETMAHGHGIRVVTDSTKLLTAHNPSRLLGVHVAVLVLRGSAGAAQAA